MRQFRLNQKKLLQAAEKMSKEKGHRWTDMREAVFACVLDQEKPVTAYQLIDQQCGNADELADHSVSKRLSTDAIYQGFKIEKQVLELQGSCRDCQT